MQGGREGGLSRGRWSCCAGTWCGGSEGGGRVVCWLWNYCSAMPHAHSSLPPFPLPPSFSVPSLQPLPLSHFYLYSPNLIPPPLFAAQEAQFQSQQTALQTRVDELEAKTGGAPA